MSHGQARILVVDDQILFRQGLVSLLRSQPDFQVVGEAGSVSEAIAQAAALIPELILMDFSLPDGTGLDAAQAILRVSPSTKIVFLTVHDEDDTLFAAIRAGAKGYLLKNVRVEKLLSYLRGVQQGEPAVLPEMTARILDAFARTSASEQANDALAQLTPREQEVLDEIGRDASNSDIAKHLFISEFTVKNHVRSILAKLDLPNRHAAARYAREKRS